MFNAVQVICQLRSVDG